LEVETNLEPIELLEFCLSVENELGRVREEVWGPRIIDIDVLMYEDLEIYIDNLIVPYYKLQLRKFVYEILNLIVHNAVNKIIHNIKYYQLTKQIPRKKDN